MTNKHTDVQTNLLTKQKDQSNGDDDGYNFIGYLVEK